MAVSPARRAPVIACGFYSPARHTAPVFTKSKRKAMSTPWFFLSYSRIDSVGKPLLKKFYRDLVEEVHQKAALRGVKDTDIGFLDTSNILTGTYWPEELAAALSTCRVMVCMYSRGYFSSPFCGEEFQVFRSRVEGYVEKSSPKVKRPPLILPVFWDGPGWVSKSMPKAVSNLQYHDDSLGSVEDSLGMTYAREGLYYLMKVNKPEHVSEYNDFIFRFAQRIVTEAEPDRLRSLDALKPLAEVKSAFQDLAPAVASGGDAAPETARGGPGVAQFFYVVGRGHEFTNIRHSLDSYGETGPAWKPYYPEVPTSVGIMSQLVTAGENLLYEPHTVDTDFIDKLRRAEDNDNIVVIIVDPWSIQVQSYKDYMCHFDEKEFVNCGVLIPWNDKDDETSKDLDKLQAGVQQAFSRKFVFKTYLRESIRSPEELRKEICNTINEARGRLLLRAKVQKSAGAGGGSMPLVSNSSQPPDAPPTTLDAI